MDFVSCPFSPAALSLLLQHSLSTGCSSGGPVSEVSIAVVGVVVDTDGVKGCHRKAQGEVESVSVFGKAKSVSIP